MGRHVGESYHFGPNTMGQWAVSVSPPHVEAKRTTTHRLLCRGDPSHKVLDHRNKISSSGRKRRWQWQRQQPEEGAGAAAMAAAVTTATATPLCRGLSSSSGAKPRLATVRCGAARVEGLGRREALLSVLLSTTAAASAPAAAVAATTELQEGFRTYEDEANKFSIAIPQDWLVGAGEVSGFKSVTAFYPDQVADSNVSVAITGIGPDFTSLKSFGDVDAFAETLVNGLDRSWKRPPGVAAKLIDSRAANGFYYIEYTLQNPGEQRRHIVSAIGMAFNGWYNRLYTVTGQYIDEDVDVEKYRAQIEKCVQSFRFT